MAQLAVIDVETTGLNPYRHDRVVELAVVRMSTDGEISREFVTLINPERDIGPTTIHGLTGNDIIAAPRFAEVAGSLIEELDGCVAIAGHNVQFDHSFLSEEFARLGLAFPLGPRICTMKLAGGGSLLNCCEDYDILFDGDQHSALYDARAAARLLVSLLKDAPSETAKLKKLSPISWPKCQKALVQLITRVEAQNRQAKPPTYLQKLFAKAENSLVPITDDSVTLAYTALLDRALEDRNVDDAEANSLFDLASKWGILGDQVKEIHRKYLLQLAGVALADGLVSNRERQDLHKVAFLLGHSEKELDELLENASRMLKQEAELHRASPSRISHEHQQLRGMSVCFTGELQCRYSGDFITRETATELAQREGMIVVESVTKKLGLLVLADPQSQSGKAKKARKYGIRILHEAVFWKALGINVD